MDQHSARTLYVAYISSDEYPTFRRGLPADDRLPETWEHAAHRAAGYHTEPVVVHWDDLIKHTTACASSPATQCWSPWLSTAAAASSRAPHWPK